MSLWSKVAKVAGQTAGFFTGGPLAVTEGGKLGENTTPGQVVGATAGAIIAGPEGIATGAKVGQAIQDKITGGPKSPFTGPTNPNPATPTTPAGTGGSAMAAGTNALQNSNPYLAGGLNAFSAMSGTVGENLKADTSQRNTIRSYLTTNKLTDSSGNIKLADGTIANLAGEASNTHTFKYGDKVVGSDGRSGLHSYDTDYTNDMDFFSGQGGVALSRLLTGGDATSVKQVGAQLGNAALGKVGFGAKMDEGNFNTVMANLRSMYASSGINSKDEAFALSNKLFAAKQINALDLTQMQQTFNMVYNNDFNLANKLSAGRWNGIDVAGKATQDPNSPVSGVTNAVNKITRSNPAANAVTGQTGGPAPSMAGMSTQPGVLKPGESPQQVAGAVSGQSTQNTPPPQAPSNVGNATGNKDQIIAQNKAKFQNGSAGSALGGG